jgi:hypothetical protein
LIKRGIIQKVLGTDLGFSLANFIGGYGEQYTDAKRYQSYGFQTFPLSIGDDLGCEVIYSDDSGENVIIAENDPRFRRDLALGDVALFTHHKDQNIKLSSKKQAIDIESNKDTKIHLDETGLIALSNQVASLELTLAHIKQQLGNAQRITARDSILDVVGKSFTLMKDKAYTLVSEVTKIASKTSIDLIAPNINLYGSTKATNLIMESGTIDGDVTMIPKGNNTLQSTPITFEDAMTQIALENGGTTDISHLESALTDGTGKLFINGAAQDTYARSIAKARADEAYDKGVLGITNAGTAQTLANTAFDKGVLGIGLANTAQGVADVATTDILTKEAESIARDNALQASLTALGADDGEITSFVQDNQPTSAESSQGDLWFDSNDGYKIHTYNGTTNTWVVTQDSAIGTAIANASVADGKASLAQATADGKVVTFFQNNQPTGSIGD